MRRPVRMITLPSIASRRMPVGAADVVRALGRDRGRLEPEARLAHAPPRPPTPPRCSVRAPVLERQVVVLELDLDPGHARVEHPQRLLEQLLAGLVALEDDDAQPPSAQSGATAAASPSSSARSSIARDHEGARARRSRRPAPRRPARTSSRLTPAAKLGCFSFFLTDLGVMPSMPVGRTSAQAAMKPRQLVDRVERLGHAGLARDAQEGGVAGHRVDQLLRIAALLEQLQRLARVAGVEVRVALVVEVVQQAGDRLQLLVLAHLRA